MKKTKFLALGLSAALLAGMLVPVAAENGGGDTQDKGLVINKTATYKGDDTFEIKLEAYATGSKVISEVKKDVPTDIILVLDQSGSMTNYMETESYTAYTNTKNSNLYRYRHNGGSENLWYNLGENQYVSVSIELTQQVNYISYDPGTSHNTYKDNENNLYALVGGSYQKISIVTTKTFIVATEYEYRLPDNTVIATATLTWDGWSLSVISNTDDGKIYQVKIDDTKTTYTYSYTAKDGTHTIGTSTGADTQFTEKTLYSKSTGEDITRLKAIQNAVTAFADNVNEKAKGADGQYGTADDVNHRIAVVGFSGTNNVGTNYQYYYKNTEIFIGSTQYRYDNVTTQIKKSAFQNMNSKDGYENVIASKDALTADGPTYVDRGIELANQIFDANPLKDNETRNRVVVVFTDGAPGYDGKFSGNSYGSTWGGDAQAVVDRAMTAIGVTKNTHGATVYTVGIFDGADASKDGATGDSATDTERANYFMQRLSSNTQYPQTPSYYLSAGDSASLNNIFQQIANEVETGGSSTKLDSSAVIKDIIAPQFQLPAGATTANITLENYACTGKTNGEYTWSKNAIAMGATATINATSGNVDVTGFDFAENYVGTVTENGQATYRGHKLVIKFNVQTKDGFLGGNDVFTNTSAGVYENAAATEPVLTFPRPQVNVPIKDVTVTAGDKNVYLLGSLTAAEIKSGATAQCGDVELKLNETNYGLESWQNEYVNITVTYEDKDGNTINNLSDLQDDTTYTVSVTVSPKTETPESTEGTVATEKTGSKEGKINVFKPELTFQDSTVYYGDNAPESYTGNLTKTEWKHNGTLDSAVTMIGTQPTLALTYTPEAGKIVGNKITTKQDIPVDVAVNIGTTNVTDKTTFVHTKCDTNEADPTTGKFWLHVKTCSLTITKAAGANTNIGDDEYFVFNVMKDSKLYTQVTIQGTGSVTISELPVGTYTVEEDSATAWRYTASMPNDPVTLSKDNTSATVTCTNTLTNNKWLNDFTRVINTFGAASGVKN